MSILQIIGKKGCFVKRLHKQNGGVSGDGVACADVTNFFVGGGSYADVFCGYVKDFAHSRAHSVYIRRKHRLFRDYCDGTVCDGTVFFVHYRKHAF